MTDDDRPVDVGIDTREGITTVPCVAVSTDCLDGYLALFEPLGLEPAGTSGLEIGDGDVMLVDDDRIETIQADPQHLTGMLGGDD